ncbi:hypothetical protein [uncultured Brevundimonas sp.]|uniref:hypothetical protein n=1 Tax=uncultured Brevundimonas sp. TaxID=213418 RepID=UPI00263483BB|nr:hypothetical protein [uncultured Brevundimonas sp.]
MTDEPNTETDLWVHVRRDYQAGQPAALVAERYRISVRSLRRRATGSYSSPSSVTVKGRLASLA